jgi:hypothetical protein
VTTPPLVGVCLACRTAYPAGWACAGGDGHDVVPLDEPAGRTRLVDTVWGSSDDRRRTAALAAAVRRRNEFFAGGGGAAGLVASIAMYGGGAGVALLLGGGIVAGGAVAHVTRSRAPMEFPRAAGPRRSVAATGRARVRGAAALVSPGGGEPCAAWEVELRFHGPWGDRVTLRAGATAGMELALDDGEVVRIAAGPIALDERAVQVDDAASPGLVELLRALDPARPRGDRFSPVPYNVVAETLLFVEDRVEVVGALEPVVARRSGEATYRDAPRTVLVPRGLPVLRRIRY